MATDHWENKDEIGVRTKIALRILLLMFKVLSPYQFEHRFEKDITKLEADINAIGKEAKN